MLSEDLFQKASLASGSLFDTAGGKNKDKKHFGHQEALAIKTWVFAHQKNIPTLQNSAIDAIREMVLASWTFMIHTISWMYNATPRSAKIRRFIALISVGTNWAIVVPKSDSDGKPLSFEDCEVVIPKAFLADCFAIMHKKFVDEGHGAERAPRSWLENLDLCPYHEHKDGQTCATLAKEYA
ncbi:MAG: hypothetical protein Q9159_001060 [Coniocarpon cinnabarinum]